MLIIKMLVLGLLLKVLGSGLLRRGAPRNDVEAGVNCEVKRHPERSEGSLIVCARHGDCHAHFLGS